MGSNTRALVPNIIVSVCPFHDPHHQKPHQEQFVFTGLMHISIWMSLSSSSHLGICQSLMSLESLHCDTSNIHTLTSHPAGERRQHEKFCGHELKVVYYLFFRRFNVTTSGRGSTVLCEPSLTFPLPLEFREESEQVWNYMLVPETGAAPTLEWKYTSKGLASRGWWKEQHRQLCAHTLSHMLLQPHSSPPPVSCTWFIYSFSPFSEITV